jgi:hypothetical protein
MSEPSCPRLLSAYRTIRDTHAALYTLLQNIEQAVPTHGTPKVIADGVLICRKSAELCEDMASQLKRMQGVLSKTGGIMYVAKGDGEPLRGAYATGAIKVSKAVAVPSRSKEPEKYALLCDIMGAPDHPLTRLNFPAIKERISQILAAGENLPPALEAYKQYDDCNLVATERSGSQLETDATQQTYLF